MLGGRKKRFGQRGIALVETMIVTPLLLLLVLATAEITNAYVDHNTLTKSVRNGARYLAGKAVLGTTGNIVLTTEKAQATRRLIVYGIQTIGEGESPTPILAGLTMGDVQITVLGDDVVVSASYDYFGILGDTLPSFGFGSDIDLGLTLQATVSMRGL